MARVPTLVDNQVQLRPLTQERYDVTDRTVVGRTIGAGMQRIGQSLEGIAKVEDEIDQMQDAARAKQADNEWQQATREILYGEQGFYRKQNADALNSRKTVEQQLEEKRQELINRAQTPRERQMLSDVLMTRSQQELEGIARYTQAQTREYAKLQSNARLKNFTDGYARYYSVDNERADMELRGLKSEVRDQAVLLGIQDASVIAAMERDAMSEAHTNVVRTMMLTNLPGADQYYAENRDSIDVATRVELERQLKPAMVQWQGKTIASEIGSAPPVDGAPVPMKPMATSKWTVISRPGASRDGGKRIHQGYDIAPSKGSPGWYPTQDFTISNPRNAGGNAGLVADVIMADGTKMKLMHLASLPKAGSYKAGQLAAIAGNTGNAKNTPTHFHVEAVDSAGRRIDPTKHFIGGTGGPAHGAGAEGHAASLDLGQQIAAVDEYVKQNFADRPAFERDQIAEAAKAEVRRNWGENKRVDAERYEKEEAAAWEMVHGLDDNFTSISQLPNYGSLDWRAQSRFRELAKANSKRATGGVEPETDWEFYAKMNDLASTNRAQFMAINPADARARLGDTEYKEYVRLRAKPESADSAKAVTFNDILGETKLSLQAAGYKMGEAAPPAHKKAVNDFLLRMNTWAQGVQQQTGKWPTADQIRQRGDQMLIAGEWKNPGEWGKTKGFWFQRPNEGETFTFEVPENARRKIIRALASDPSFSKLKPDSTEYRRRINQAYFDGKGIDW